MHVPKRRKGATALAGDWTKWSPEDPSSSNYFGILWNSHESNQRAEHLGFDSFSKTPSLTCRSDLCRRQGKQGESLAASCAPGACTSSPKEAGGVPWLLPGFRGSCRGSVAPAGVLWLLPGYRGTGVRGWLSPLR